MEIEWPDARGNLRRGEIPANVQLFVDIIGLNDAVKLLLACGGSTIYFGRRPNGGLVEQAIGEAAARQIGRELGGMQYKVPLSPRFLARFLRSQGDSTAKIARTLRMSEGTARQHLQHDLSNRARRSPRRARRHGNDHQQ